MSQLECSRNKVGIDFNFNFNSKFNSKSSFY